jgi:hypothetical protein
MVLPRRQPRVHRRWSNSDTYHYSDELGLTRLGALLAGSKEVVRAKITGTEANHDKVGQAGDGLLTATAVTAHVNDILGNPPTSPEDAAA